LSFNVRTFGWFSSLLTVGAYGNTCGPLPAGNQNKRLEVKAQADCGNATEENSTAPSTESEWRAGVRRFSFQDQEQAFVMRFNLRFAVVLLVALVQVKSGIAQAVSGAAPAAAAARVTSGVVRGHVTDPTGALIPGAHIAIVTAAGQTSALVTADASGAFAASGLPAGSYVLKASADGFAAANSAVFQLLAGQSKRVDIAMAIVAEQQSVTVSDDDTPMVGVEADNNANSVVLKDKDLDALSDDPDELSSELTALAGPAAGPNGGEVYIGGFTGGQLPPKSAIREIRVNQNPYSAEFDHLGYGRIEILTKPGTDQLHGRYFTQGNDDAFNTGNPFVNTIPAYHSVQYNGSVSGAAGKKASFFFNVEERNNQNASIYSMSAPVLSGGTYAAGTLAGALFNPSTHTEISPRMDLQLGEKHTVTLRYQFERFSQSGSIGTQQDVTTANSSSSVEHTLQLSDSWILNDHMVNETRLQYLRELSNSIPVSSAPTVSVAGTMTTGGASGQTSHDHADHVELQNITTMSHGAHAIKFGARLRLDRDASRTNANFNGTFTFSSLDSYIALLNDMAKASTNGWTNQQTWTHIAADGGLPTKLSYTTGPQEVIAANFDGALFVQDDWKVNPFLTLSGGLRWETQNHIRDHSDFGPRVAFAYALDGHKDKTHAKTVLRGGYGFFYDRFWFTNLQTVKRYGGTAASQTAHVITNPTCFNSTSFSAIDLGSCGSTTARDSSVYQINTHYHSPYVGQVSVSLERQLTKTVSLSITGLRSYGVHQQVVRDANAYTSGSYVYGSSTLTGTRPNSAQGIVLQYDPEGIFKQNQLIVNVNANLSKKFSMSGFYNLNSAHGISGTVSNSYNYQQDYKRAAWTSRNMLFLMGNYTAPLNLVFNPFLIAQSGRPFNFVSPYDLTGDNFYNSRPAVADSSTCSANSATTRYVQTGYGCMDMTPDSTEALLPGNFGTSPAAMAFNLRLTRAFGIGPKLPGAAGQASGQSGSPSGGGPGFGGGRGPMGGGGGRGPMGGSMSTGHKYSLSFSAQALNLFNNINYGTPVGTVNSSKFGKSTSLNGGIFSSGSASRRVYFQAAFSF